MTEMTEVEAAELEDLWQKEMVRIYEDALKIGYEATIFRGLMASHGPLRAAKMLINMDVPSDGFEALWTLKRLDISVEARALKPEFRDLFSAAGVSRPTSGPSVLRGSLRSPSWVDTATSARRLSPRVPGSRRWRA